MGIVLGGMGYYLIDRATSEERGPVIRHIEQWIESHREEKGEINDIQLHSFVGLKGVRDEQIFQDFGKPDRQRNKINPIQHLWADAYHHGSIMARVIHDANDRQTYYLRVEFANGTKDEEQWAGFRSNVAIRAQNEMALRRSPEYRWLTFFVRYPKSDSTSPFRRVEITVRVIDARFTHWEYRGVPDLYYSFLVNEPDKWIPCDLDLEGGLNAWKLFDADGNWKYATTKPDFSMLVSVILEFSTLGGGPGSEDRGVVDIADLHLRP